MLFKKLNRTLSLSKGTRLHTTFLHSYFLYLLLILLSSCSYTEVGKPLPEINSVKNGEKFFINLPENHAESFMWKLSDDYNKNLIEQVNAVWHGNEKGVDYHFKAKQSGQDTLNFTLYKYNEVSKYLSFVVKVQ